MNLIERNAITKKFFEDAHALLERKGRDYAPDGGAFDNFDTVASIMCLSREEVCLAYLCKQLAAIRTSIKGTALVAEPIIDRLRDVANYAAILTAMVSTAGTGLPPTEAAPRCTENDTSVEALAHFIDCSTASVVSDPAHSKLGQYLADLKTGKYKPRTPVWGLNAVRFVLNYCALSPAFLYDLAEKANNHPLIAIMKKGWPDLAASSGKLPR
jgi:hypothetical protein